MNWGNHPKPQFIFFLVRQKENRIKRKNSKTLLRPFGGKRHSRALSSETSSCGMFSLTMRKQLCHLAYPFLRECAISNTMLKHQGVCRAAGG